MPSYLLYRDDLEEIAADEPETHAKINELMTQGMHLVREKVGHSVRISHAKAHALLQGTLTVHDNLPPELAQGLFARPATYPVLARMAQAPGEYLDDSKVRPDRGLSVKVLGVQGEKIEGDSSTVQDWVFDAGKQFLTGAAKQFLQAFKPNAELAPKLSDTVKGAVSKTAAAANAALQAVGANSEKLAFYGHPAEHPLAESYFSQTPYRYGDYVAKLGFFPVTPGIEELKKKGLNPEMPNGLREAMEEFFKSRPAEFEMRVQLNTGEDEMPIEDAQANWPEASSEYQPVARLVLPAQTAWDEQKDRYFEFMSFSPGHALAAHRPLGSINRARLSAYRALAERRLADNNRAEEKPSELAAVPS